MTDTAVGNTRVAATIALWPPSRGHVVAFLKTPLAWVLLAMLAGFGHWDASVRADTTVVCGAVSIAIDRQVFAGEYDGANANQIRFMQACEGFAQPDTLDVRGGVMGRAWFE